MRGPEGQPALKPHNASTSPHAVITAKTEDVVLVGRARKKRKDTTRLARKWHRNCVLWVILCHCSNCKTKTVKPTFPSPVQVDKDNECATCSADIWNQQCVQQTTTYSIPCLPVLPEDTHIHTRRRKKMTGMIGKRNSK